MATMRIVVCASLLLACGDKGDECQQLVDKLVPWMNEQGGPSGKTVSDADKTKMLTECRDRKKSGKSGGDEAMQKCVLAAKDQAAVGACLKPQFEGYMERGKRASAEIGLNKLAKLSKVIYHETSAFPVGKAGPTPPQPCCERTCLTPSETWAKDPMWSRLDFEMSEPEQFQYSVDSDGQQLTARAVGDLDCDGTMITYTLEMTVVDGVPTAKITKPQNAD